MSTDNEVAGLGVDVRIEPYAGAREELRGLFELAEDSPAELDSYLHAGRVLVARSGQDVLGHLQLVDDRHPGRVELKNMAVREAVQGRGVGSRLVRAALDLAAAEAAHEMVVATAAADVGNLRFYQRQGFRFRSVERDAFGPAAGYPPGIEIDGIALRDRVWLDRPVHPDHPEPYARPPVGRPSREARSGHPRRRRALRDPTRRRPPPRPALPRRRRRARWPGRYRRRHP